MDAENFTIADNFNQYYFLSLDDDDFTILDFNTIGIFENIETMGQYRLHAVNFYGETINSSNWIESPLIYTISEFTNCWDIETAAEPSIVVDSIEILPVDFECNAITQSYSQAYTFLGGVPQYLLDIGFANENDSLYSISGDIDGFYPFTTGLITYPDTLDYTITVTDNGGCSSTITGIPEINCVKLAIDLLHFEGKIKERGNELIWQTASEENNEAFILQRSTDGINFESIAEIKGAGTSNTTTSYIFFDQTIIASSNFYRLLARETGADTQKVSEVILLSHSPIGFELISVAPVPVDKYLTIIFNTVGKQEIILSTYNAVGQLLNKQQLTSIAGRNHTLLDVADYAAGTYILNLSNGMEVVKMTFVKK